MTLVVNKNKQATVSMRCAPGLTDGHAPAPSRLGRPPTLANQHFFMLIMLTYSIDV